MSDVETPRMPAIFFGHGSPGNVMEENRITTTWRDLGKEIGKPKGVICISAHWFIGGTGVTAMERPRTIHDFGGFPKIMYEMHYDAPGDPALAARVAERLKPIDVALDQSWGFDHGTWCVLTKVYPEADVPIVQLSIDARKPPRFHYELGRMLAPFRDEGILIAGSGNIVHNLPEMNWRSQSGGYQWAQRFGDYIRKAIVEDEPDNIVNYAEFGRDAMLSVPTPEHYLPLLYVIGARDAADDIRFENEFVEYGSLDMTTVVVGSMSTGQ